MAYHFWLLVFGLHCHTWIGRPTSCRPSSRSRLKRRWAGRVLSARSGPRPPGRRPGPGREPPGTMWRWPG